MKKISCNQYFLCYLDNKYFKILNFFKLYNECWDSLLVWICEHNWMVDYIIFVINYIYIYIIFFPFLVIVHSGINLITLHAIYILKISIYLLIYYNVENISSFLYIIHYYFKYF